MFDVKPRIVYFFKSLILEVYTVGYSPQGESIIFFVKADDYIKFSGVIDCYQTDHYNITCEILKHSKITMLDFLCWSHPDLDHSLGLDCLINCFVGIDTLIYLPEGIINLEHGSETISPIFNLINIGIKQRRFNVHSTSDIKELLLPHPVQFQYNTNCYDLKLLGVSPFSSIIRRKIQYNTFHKNDYSIMSILALGDIIYYFTGDIEDDTVSELVKRLDIYGAHVHFLKIPHHGSEGSCGLLNTCGVVDHSSTTIYRKGRLSLPQQSAIEKYKSKCPSCWTTGDITSQSPYGIVKLSTNILTKECSVDVIGAAHKL